MAGIVEVDRLLKARIVFNLVAVVTSTAILVLGLSGGSRTLYLSTLTGASVGALAVGLWRGRYEADQYVVRRRAPSQLPPRITPARAVRPDCWIWGVIAVGLIVLAFLTGPLAAAGLGGGNGALVGGIASSVLERRGWRRLMNRHQQQVWVVPQPPWRLRSRSRAHAEGVFVLDEQPVPAAWLPSEL